MGPWLWFLLAARTTQVLTAGQRDRRTQGQLATPCQDRGFARLTQGLSEWPGYWSEDRDALSFQIRVRARSEWWRSHTYPCTIGVREVVSGPHPLALGILEINSVQGGGGVGGSKSQPLSLWIPLLSKSTL